MGRVITNAGLVCTCVGAGNFPSHRLLVLAKRTKLQQSVAAVGVLSGNCMTNIRLKLLQIDGLLKAVLVLYNESDSTFKL